MVLDPPPPPPPPVNQECACSKHLSYFFLIATDFTLAAIMIIKIYTHSLHYEVHISSWVCFSSVNFIESLDNHLYAVAIKIVCWFVPSPCAPCLSLVDWPVSCVWSPSCTLLNRKSVEQENAKRVFVSENQRWTGVDGGKESQKIPETWVRNVCCSTESCEQGA